VSLRPVLVIALAAAVPGLLAQTAPPRALFREVARASGIEVTHVNGASPEKHLVETMGSGTALLDVDADGFLDLFVVDGGSLANAQVAARAGHRLYRNRGDGTFADVSAASGIAHAEYGQGACVGDVDNDGRDDIYVTNLGPNMLYRNQGGGRFADVTRTARTAAGGWSTSCAFFDIERDGDLDLFVANYLDASRTNNKFCGDKRRQLRVYCHPLAYNSVANVLYRNNGDGTFTDVSEAMGVGAARGNGLGVAVGDVDDDGWPDVFVANDAVPNFLFRNDRGTRFEETALAAGVAVARDGKPRAGMGTEFADFTGDGRLDLGVTNHEFETHSLFRNDDGSFVDATVPSGVAAATLPYVGFATAFFDYANSGWLAYATVNGHVVDNTAMVRPGSAHAQRKLLFATVDGRRFTEIAKEAGPGFAAAGVGRSLVTGDIDNDGDIDLVVTNNGGPLELLRNDSAAANALLVKLVGVKSNRDGIGARLRATVGKRTLVREVKSGAGYLGQSDLRAHFGLGASRTVERLQIRWPSGTVETLANVGAGQIVLVREGLGIVSRTPFVRGSRP
jgi:enediyne biosynthesis protein E4